MKAITVIMIITIISFLAVSSAKANMSSPDYILQMPNLNFAAGNVTDGANHLGFTGGQNMPGEYTSTGYKVLAGFWYLKTIIPFSFTISNQLIDFGSLTPGVPSTAQTILTVSNGSAGGYQVTAQENHPLMVYSTGAKILDTTGDDGSITESLAGVWAQNTTYGFGYTLYGNDVPSPFPSAPPVSNFYKQFSDTSQNETPQIVMSSLNVGRHRTAVVTYKVNVSANQPAGRYQNVITYIATPTY